MEAALLPTAYLVLPYYTMEYHTWGLIFGFPHGERKFISTFKFELSIST